MHVTALHSSTALSMMFLGYACPRVSEVMVQVPVDCTVLLCQLLQQPVDAALRPTSVGERHHKLTSVISFQFIETFNHNFVLTEHHYLQTWSEVSIMSFPSMLFKSKQAVDGRPPRYAPAPPPPPVGAEAPPSRRQRSSSFTWPTRSHAHCCSRLTCQHGSEQSGLVTLTFDLFTLKVVSKLRVTWATSVPILVVLFST